MGEMRAPVIAQGRKLHRQFHGTEALHIMLPEFWIRGSDLAQTEAEAPRYQGKCVESNFHHYEFLGEHFRTVKGYDACQQKAEIARKAVCERGPRLFAKEVLPVLRSWGPYGAGKVAA